MERIIWIHQSEKPFYVFDEKYIVHFWDDGVSVHHANELYRDVDTRLSPFEGPHIYPKALPLDFYRRAVLNERLPIALELEGDNLGVVKRTPGYGDAEIGSYKRTIVRQRTSLSLADGYLAFGLEVGTTPVDPETVDAEIDEEDRLPQEYAFEFSFPLDIVPELFNLTESERRAFERSRDRSQA
jgi:hypothetical protein